MALIEIAIDEGKVDAGKGKDNCTAMAVLGEPESRARAGGRLPWRAELSTCIRSSLDLIAGGVAELDESTVMGGMYEVLCIGALICSRR